MIKRNPILALSPSLRSPIHAPIAHTAITYARNECVAARGTGWNILYSVFLYSCILYSCIPVYFFCILIFLYFVNCVHRVGESQKERGMLLRASG